MELLVVPDCPHAEAARELLDQALSAAGLAGTPLRVQVIRSEGEAQARGFLGSPAFLVNGVDPFARPGQTPAMACRVYPGTAGLSGLPDVELLTAALAAAREQGG